MIKEPHVVPLVCPGLHFELDGVKHVVFGLNFYGTRNGKPRSPLYVVTAELEKIGGEPVFNGAAAPTWDVLQTALAKFPVNSFVHSTRVTSVISLCSNI